MQAITEVGAPGADLAVYVGSLAEELDGFVEPAEFTVNSAEVYQRNALSYAAADFMPDGYGLLKGIHRLTQPPGEQVDPAEIVEGHAFAEPVAGLAADAYCALQAFDGVVGAAKFAMGDPEAV